MILLVMTLLRVFMNRESPSAYKMMFKSVFELVHQITQKPPRFHHLHGEGLKAIVLDMDPSQMKGKIYPKLVFN
jgi:hypothetical protein